MLLRSTLLLAAMALAGCTASFYDSVAEGEFLLPVSTENSPPHPLSYNGSFAEVAWDGGAAEFHAVQLVPANGSAWTLRGVLSVKTEAGDRLLVREGKLMTTSPDATAQVLWATGAMRVRDVEGRLALTAPASFEIGGEVRMVGHFESPEYTGIAEVRSELVSVTAETPVPFTFRDATVRVDDASVRMVGARAALVTVEGVVSGGARLRDVAVPSDEFAFDMVDGRLDVTSGNLVVESSVVQLAYDGKPRLECRLRVLDLQETSVEGDVTTFQASIQVTGAGSAEHARAEAPPEGAQRIDAGLFRPAESDELGALVRTEGFAGQTLSPGVIFALPISVESLRPGDHVTVRAQNCRDAALSLRSA